MGRKLPIGVSDFREIIEDNYYYVDKTLLIKEILDDGAKVLLLPRPRRFGKTLNMTMLKYFFLLPEQDGESNNRHLFEKLNIWQEKEYQEYQGKYPVVYLTFKDIKNDTLEVAISKMKSLLSEEYEKHAQLLGRANLTEVEQEYIQRIVKKQANQGECEESLRHLIRFLYRGASKKVILLIDEYDVPIQSGYIGGYYDEMMSFMRNFLSGGLKDNEYLAKAVITGILRIAKESVFSGLNNLRVCTLLNEAYSDKFGLLEHEVEDFLKDYSIEGTIAQIRDWYNGYICGKCMIYNPWSILNYTSNWHEGFRPYWVNTSSNDLVKILITQGSKELKQEMEDLMRTGEIDKEINEDIVMKEIGQNSGSIWSLLLFSGYLKPKRIHRDQDTGILRCLLQIPNKEVGYLYRSIVLSWFEERIGSHDAGLMVRSLLSGDIETFEDILAEYLSNSLSYFDVSGEEPEKFYHAFVLGLLVHLSGQYQVKSNRESGLGRYDIMLIPVDKTKNGVIIEFKKVNKRRKETLEIAANVALTQIMEKKYRQELLGQGIDNIIELGIAFAGKEVLVKAVR